MTMPKSDRNKTLETLNELIAYLTLIIRQFVWVLLDALLGKRAS